MIKSIIFLSLYTVSGLGAWGAYSFISEQDSSLLSLGLIASQIQPATDEGTNSAKQNIIYRWQDYQGNWTYEDQPYSEINFKNYDDELKFLQKLQSRQEELLPSRHTATNAQASEPTLPLINTIKQLFADAKNIQHLIDSREKQIDEISQN